jgi:hypothetical protein
VKAIQFSEAEVAQQDDFDALSAFAREGVDHVVGGAVGYPNHWSAFTVAKKGVLVDGSGGNPTVVTVTPGRLFSSDLVYAADAAIDVDLMLYMPSVSANRRWVGLIVQGESTTENATRMIETDAETELTVEMSVPKVLNRKVNVVPQPGPIEIALDPTKPGVPAGQSCIAFVLLGTTGVLDIAPGTAWRAKTLYEVEGRVTAIEISLETALVRVGTLETDLTPAACRSPVPRSSARCAATSRPCGGRTRSRPARGPTSTIPRSSWTCGIPRMRLGSRGSTRAFSTPTPTSKRRGWSWSTRTIRSSSSRAGA